MRCRGASAHDGICRVLCDKPIHPGSAWQRRRCKVLGRRAGPGPAIVAVPARQARLATSALRRDADSQEDLVQETGIRNGSFGADKFGLRNLEGGHWNLGALQLYPYSLAAGGGGGFAPRGPRGG